VFARASCQARSCSRYTLMDVFGGGCGVLSDGVWLAGVAVA